MTWNPLAEQVAESDTLFLLDPTTESALAPGNGGLIPADLASGDTPWQPSSSVAEVPGRYRVGLQSVQRSYGYLSMPLADYLPTNQFTIEMWLKGAKPWSQIVDNTPFALVATFNDGVRVNIDNGRLAVRYIEDQTNPATSVALSYNAAAIPADQWVNLAVTYANNVLRLYINGNVVASAQNVAAPSVWSDESRGEGLSIGGALGKGATDMVISDLRISRDARAPGQSETVSNDNDVTVNTSTPTGGVVNQDLLGGLNTLGGPQTESMAQGNLHVLRVGKMLTATPIKAGAPDATHPTPGISGKYSYDWQVVDRTFAYLARLGLKPYVSIGSTPQILGGNIAPFTGTNLATNRSTQSAFARQVPNDMAAWGDIVKDLVYHVTVEDGYTVPYWGVWNEPDGSSFWTGTLADYLSLYETTATAVKSVNPNLQVGGPETASWNTTWVQALINDCAAKGIPLDFVSWHYYSGNLGEIAQARAQVSQWAAAAGIPTPRIVVGEWAWQSANLPGGNGVPWSQTNYFLNDWHGAFVAESLMQMQANGVAAAITRPVAEGTGTGWNGTGLMSSTAPWANLNVFRLWSMLGPNVVSSTYTGTPGVMEQASTKPDGTLTVLLAYLRYRKDVEAPVAVHLPASFAGDSVTDYVIDDHHSDAWDAGPDHAGLEGVAGTPVSSDGTTGVDMRPRSVHLLVIHPAGT